MNKTTLKDNIIIDIPKIEDPRGNLSVIEKDVVPFPIKRVYYLYDVPAGAERGGHAHKESKAFLVALSGSFDVVLHDGSGKQVITLNRPYRGLLITTGIWREIRNFSSAAVCLVVSSDVYDEEDYIREFDEFLEYKK